jgi:hypothetical protein
MTRLSTFLARFGFHFPQAEDCFRLSDEERSRAEVLHPSAIFTDQEAEFILESIRRFRPEVGETDKLALAYKLFCLNPDWFKTPDDLRLIFDHHKLATYGSAGSTPRAEWSIHR